jgi:hypothetical protein
LEIEDILVKEEFLANQVYQVYQEIQAHQVPLQI